MSEKENEKERVSEKENEIERGRAKEKQREGRSVPEIHAANATCRLSVSILTAHSLRSLVDTVHERPPPPRPSDKQSAI